jgi:2-methylisocitrate lyase-like PEP mutase family enzyme
MQQPRAAHLRQHLLTRDITPFIGIYDVFSATVAARQCEALFVSGFGFAASHHGVPDPGFVAWSDLVQFVQRLRVVLPDHHLLVEIDDGYGDTDIACHVVSALESVGASGVVLEDTQRPRRGRYCNGKPLLELEAFQEKLSKVLATRRELFVVARTDASEPPDIARRIHAFAEAGADAVLVDHASDLRVIRALASQVESPFAFNQIAGGNGPRVTLSELRSAGVSLVIYSTPCLFAAQGAMQRALHRLLAHDGLLEPAGDGQVGVSECTGLLRADHGRRFPASRRSPSHNVAANSPRSCS